MEYHTLRTTSGSEYQIVTLADTPSIPVLEDKANLPMVTCWYEEDCPATNTKTGETDGDASTMKEKPKRGRPRKDTSGYSPLTHRYLQNEDGTVVSKDQVAKMSRRAHMLWESLKATNLAPASYGKMIKTAWDFYTGHMLNEFPFLWYCDDGKWKLKEWSTQSYSGWAANHGV